MIAKQSGDRKTALALVLAIAASEMFLSGRAKSIWSALWGPMQGLTTVKQTKNGVQLGPLPGGPNGPGNNNSGTVPVGPGIL